MPKNDHLATTKQASQILRVDVRTVHRMAEDGRLTPVVKVPGATGPYLFNRTDVERVAASRQTTAA